MIYTMTLNPALDRTVYVKEMIERESIPTLNEVRFPGGKGINVSRVIKQLDGESIAMGFLGGYIGMEMEGLLINDGIVCNMVHTRSNTRVNVIVHCLKTGKEYRLNFPGNNIEPNEITTLFNKCRTLKPKPEFAVISGSLPKGVNPVVYQQLILIFEQQGARVIFDSYGEPFKKGLLATPYMVKPNKSELSQYVGKDIKTLQDAIAASKELLKYSEIVVLSMGEEGILGLSGDDIYRVKPPKLQAMNTVGAGDSTIAAMVIGLEENLPIDEVFRRGVAAGTASTLTDGTATITLNDFYNILELVELVKLY